MWWGVRFQSTSSVWRTTCIYIRIMGAIRISIHVLRVEDDRTKSSSWISRTLFQSTSSVWRTTIFLAFCKLTLWYFNPRPPCGGRLLGWCCWCKIFSDFNPRPPCGGRPIKSTFSVDKYLFQSTSSVWRTTRGTDRGVTIRYDFNPRPPCGGRRARTAAAEEAGRFQSTSSVWRTTLGEDVDNCPVNIFQSTSSVWRTTFPNNSDEYIGAISIHVLRVEDDP